MNGLSGIGLLTSFGAGVISFLLPCVLFVILGASATSIGQLLLSYRYEANLIGGSVVTLLGLFRMGLAKLPRLQREFRLHVNVGDGRPVATYVIGIAFAFGWTPCIGPVLGAILTRAPFQPRCHKASLC